MTTKTKTVGKTTNKEYLANSIQTTCEMITEYINLRVAEEHAIKATEVHKDFKDKEQLMSLLVIGNYLDKKLKTITESEEDDNNAITLDSATVMKKLNTVIALKEYFETNKMSMKKFPEAIKEALKKGGDK